MTILLPTTCWMIGVRGWKLNQSETLIGSLPVADLIPRHAGPGAGSVPSPPLGPFASAYVEGFAPTTFPPLPSPPMLGSVMKIQPVLEAGSCSEPTGLPPFGRGPFGHGLASNSVAACAC